MPWLLDSNLAVPPTSRAATPDVPSRTRSVPPCVRSPGSLRIARQSREKGLVTAAAREYDLHSLTEDNEDGGRGARSGRHAQSITWWPRLARKPLLVRACGEETRGARITVRCRLCAPPCRGSYGTPPYPSRLRPHPCARESASRKAHGPTSPSPDGMSFVQERGKRHHEGKTTLILSGDSLLTLRSS